MTSVLNARTTTEDGIQQDLPDRWISPRFFWGVTGMSISGLALGMVIFLLVPRDLFGTTGKLVDHHDFEQYGVTVTGVSESVRLGHLGPILESAETVFELRLFDNDAPTPTPVSMGEFLRRQEMEEPLFRGYVLETYDWGGWSSPHVAKMLMNLRPSPRQGTTGLIRQEYLLQTLERNVLFCMRPILAGAARRSETILYNPWTDVLTARADPRERFDYVIYSNDLVNRRRRWGRPTNWREEWSDYLQPDMIAGLRDLKALAAQWSAPERLLGDETMSLDRRRAMTIESRLRDSGEFSYTVRAEIDDDSRDPVEDFLLNTKRGHCEYFASALALLLRAVDIPTRLVTGFKGAEPVARGNYYEVQKRHAHAWVEAFVDGDWITLDATPAAREDSVRSFAADKVFWKSASNSLSVLWSTYVISMSYNRQKEALYEPLQGTVSEGWTSIADLVAQVRGIASWFDQQVSSPEQFANGSGPLLLLGLTAGFAVVLGLARHERRLSPHRVRGDRRTLSPWRRWWNTWLMRRWGRAPTPRMIVEFYDQFLDLVSAGGLRPQPHDTHREFSLQVEQSLGHVLAHDGLASLPRDVTELYCRVRFGGAEPPPAEIMQLDDRLQRLAVVICQAARRKGTAQSR